MTPPKPYPTDTRSPYSRDPSEESPEEQPVEVEEERKPARPRSRRLSHRGHGTLSVTGISGKVYRFIGHGAVQRVAAGDVEKLLEITRENRGCCGAKAVRRQQLLVAVR